MTKTSILIADDSDISRAMLKVMLGDTWIIYEAKDGHDTLEKYLSYHPEVILLDIQMPGIDGLAIIEEIRTRYCDQDTIIIVLTGDNTPATQTLSLNLGANDFLTKSFRKPELLARIGVAERQIATTKQLRTYSERIKQEIKLVASLQQKLLPDQSPLIPGVFVESLYRPSGHASGDYYDYFTLPGTNTLRVGIADVSGHGARAAFIMGIVSTLFKLTQTRPMSLTDTVRHINKHLMDIIGTEEDYVTLFCADLNFTDRTMEYVNAGHCPGLLRNGNGTIERLNATSPLIGFFDIRPETHQCPFTEGSRLFLFTDGFFDWRLANGDLFTFSMFWDFAASLMDSSSNYVDKLQKGLADIAGGTENYRDDITALWIATGQSNA